MRAGYRKIIELLALALLVATAFGADCLLEPARPVQLKLTAAEWQWLAEHGREIRVGAEPYSPPLVIVENGRMQGMLADYYRLIEQRLGIEFKRVPAPSFAAMLDMAKSGQVDLVALVAVNAERARYLREKGSKRAKRGSELIFVEMNVVLGAWPANSA